MRKLIVLSLLAGAIPVYGLGPAHHPAVDSGVNTIRVLPLKDGSVVYLDEHGHMTMSDPDGNAMEMKDGVKMQLMEGSAITMKNKPFGGRLHRIVRSHVVR